MSNALLAWNNAVDDGVTWVDGGTTVNLGDPNLSVKWTVAALSNGTLRLALTGNPTVAAFALCSHNLTLAATVRIRSYSTLGGSVGYDSGTLNAWGGSVTEASRTGMRWNFVHKLSSPTSANYWVIDVGDSGNAAGIRIGRLLAAKNVWQPSVNMLTGASIAWESNYQVSKAINGAEWFVEAEGHRVVRFSLDNMGDDEMLRNAFDIQRAAAGARRELLFQWDPSDNEHSVRRTVFGRVRTLSPMEEPSYGRKKTAFEIKELL